MKSSSKTHLYIIGNGFDRYHGAESGYKSFRRYLYRRNPLIVGYFDLYFGPRSLDRSFSTPVGWWWCLQSYEYRHDEYGLRYPIATWAKSNLWCDFEKYMGELNREKVFDLLDMSLPRIDENDENFSYADFYAPLDEIKNMVESCTTQMRYHFHKWVNTLHYQKGFKSRMFDVDRNALFLNFNYTTFLESEYDVPNNNICYIHGSRKDPIGSLVLGHHSNDDEAFERWIHKNKNRKRYRPVQKDAKGRYYKNDKLVYLAYFLEEESEGNWRLPIRYYAADLARQYFEGYYSDTEKKTACIIGRHSDFFRSLSNIDRVTIIGHSLADVDMDYFYEVRKWIRPDARWTVSYHSDADLRRIKAFVRKLNIEQDHISYMAL